MSALLRAVATPPGRPLSSKTPPNKPAVSGRTLLLRLSVVLCAGGLFGYDQVVIIGVVGNSMTLWLLALFGGASGVWVHFLVPETKVQSLEHIQTPRTEAKT